MSKRARGTFSTAEDFPKSAVTHRRDGSGPGPIWEMHPDRPVLTGRVTFDEVETGRQPWAVDALVPRLAKAIVAREVERAREAGHVVGAERLEVLERMELRSITGRFRILLPEAWEAGCRAQAAPGIRLDLEVRLEEAEKRLAPIREAMGSGPALLALEVALAEAETALRDVGRAADAEHMRATRHGLGRLKFALEASRDHETGRPRRGQPRPLFRDAVIGHLANWWREILGELPRAADHIASVSRNDASLFRELVNAAFRDMGSRSIDSSALRKVLERHPENNDRTTAPSSGLSRAHKRREENATRGA